MEERTVAYILEWLKRRNGGELREAFDNMRVRDYRNLKEELALIVKHRGRPPNWQPFVDGEVEP